MSSIYDLYEQGRIKLGAPPIENPIEKMGSRFNKEDMADIQRMHDCCAVMCDKIHCTETMDPNDHPAPQPGESEAGMLGPDVKVGKRGARHSAASLMQLKSIHDCCKALGAKC